MGDSWGQGARSALPIVGDVFQQSFRYRWIDASQEFDIPRRPPRREQDAVQEIVNDLLGRILKMIQ
jgi:penicillin-binding protein 1A